MATNTASKRYFSIDVECVAIGYTHSIDSRAVALIAVVNYNEDIVLQVKVKPKQRVVNYLTPLTGLRERDLDEGISFDRAVKKVKEVIGSDAVLVGQRIDCDIKCLHLKEGVDYQSSIDLSELFKSFNPRYGNISYHTLRHEANTLLSPGFISEPHDPAIDAIASIKLFKKYYDNPKLLAQAKQRLLSNRPTPSWQKRNNYHYEGLCLAGFIPEKCTCGAPTLAK